MNVSVCVYWLFHPPFGMYIFGWMLYICGVIWFSFSKWGKISQILSHSHSRKCWNYENTSKIKQNAFAVSFSVSPSLSFVFLVAFLLSFHFVFSFFFRSLFIHKHSHLSHIHATNKQPNYITTSIVVVNFDERRSLSAQKKPSHICPRERRKKGKKRLCKNKAIRFFRCCTACFYFVADRAFRLADAFVIA